MLKVLFLLGMALNLSFIDGASVSYKKKLALGAASVGITVAGLCSYRSSIKMSPSNGTPMPDWRKKIVKSTLSPHLSAAKLEQLVFLENENTFGYYSCDHKGKHFISLPPSSYTSSFFKPAFDKFALLHEAGHYHNDDCGVWAKLSDLAIASLGVFMALKKGPFWRRVGCLISANLILRALRYYHESRADSFAIECLKKERDIQSLKTAIEFFKEIQFRMEEFKPHRSYTDAVFSYIFRFHPSFESRIAKVQSAIDELK